MAEKLKVFVAIAMVAARKAHAPTARGSTTNPAIVDTKIDNKLHPCTVRPSGMGTTKRSASPKETESKNGSGLAPGHWEGAGDAGRGAAAEAADATTPQETADLIAVLR